MEKRYKEVDNCPESLIVQFTYNNPITQYTMEPSKVWFGEHYAII